VASNLCSSRRHVARWPSGRQRQPVTARRSTASATGATSTARPLTRSRPLLVRCAVTLAPLRLSSLSDISGLCGRADCAEHAAEVAGRAAKRAERAAERAANCARVQASSAQAPASPAAAGSGRGSSSTTSSGAPGQVLDVPHLPWPRQQHRRHRLSWLGRWLLTLRIDVLSARRMELLSLHEGVLSTGAFGA
jgi:hypothetical protein